MEKMLYSVFFFALQATRSAAFHNHGYVGTRVSVRRGPPQLNFLSPAMSGMIAKTLNGDEYEKIVIETMKRESCSREEAEERYNTFLFDPTGYSLMKMQDQIEEKGYSNFKELFIAENGQEAWDDRQLQIEQGQKQRQMNSIIIVSVLYCVFVAVKDYIV